MQKRTSPADLTLMPGNLYHLFRVFYVIMIMGRGFLRGDHLGVEPLSRSFAGISPADL